MGKKIILNLDKVKLSNEARLILGENIPDKLEFYEVTKEELEKEHIPSYKYLIY